ncbi:MAG: tRNA epoxyqueuosine(34) reductase QueG [Rhodanobacter sp.]
MTAPVSSDTPDYAALAHDIKRWATELGFADTGISGTDLGEDEAHLQRWLDGGHHGEMEYMARHGTRRTRPAELEPGTQRIISVRMDYIPPGTANAWGVLNDPEAGYVSRYALGRDYHKLMRQRLQKLAERIHGKVGDFGYRAYVDSAPVLEKALARNAGLGWIGKHTVLINRRAGSYFFLGELYTDLPLPVDQPASEHCGSCTRCIEVCPTQAITGPYQLDAKRCISYLTIELKGSIPEELRAPMGNRIFGCDDCQLVCPWNKFAQVATEADFAPRHSLDGAKLVELFGWTEQQFLQRTEGMAIRRTGYEGWLRNIAVALGNAPPSAAVRDALQQRADDASAVVREHVAWALGRQAPPVGEQCVPSIQERASGDIP